MLARARTPAPSASAGHATPPRAINRNQKVGHHGVVRRGPEAGWSCGPRPGGLLIEERWNPSSAGAPVRGGSRAYAKRDASHTAGGKCGRPLGV